ncbi:MAG: FAD-dependent oxidoreductase [Eubacteriales bacterium]
MESLWQATSQIPSFPSLKEDMRTDVLIIGGGLSGILTAYFLQKSGVKYVLLEKGRICGGNTANTTAKITFQHGLIYHKIMKSCGEETAKKYLLANKAAFSQYASMCRNIDCDYEVKDNYVYSLDDRKKIEKELDALIKIGYNAQLREDMPLPFKTAGAVKFPFQAQFNPLKFVASVSRELNIYENTFVREMIGTTAVTALAKVRADKVIVTTHFPFINKHGSYFLKLYQHRSYVIALENAPDLDGMYVDEDNKGFSFRNYKGFLLLGGGSHKTGKKGGSFNEVRGFAAECYKDAKEKYAWSAQDCMSLDKIPYIGNYSKNTPDMYTASGFNKWGMTGSMLSAMLLCDMITGKKNEFSDIFSPSRSIIKPQLFVNGFEAVKNLLTISKKRCPHLGCALKWNGFEHSWDCPCHGSRFSESGKLLDNPANGDLKINK